MDVVLGEIAELKREVGTLRAALENSDQRPLVCTFSHTSAPVDEKKKEDKRKVAKKNTRQASRKLKDRESGRKKEPRTSKSALERLPSPDCGQSSVGDTDGATGTEDNVWKMARRNKKPKKVTIDQVPLEGRPVDGGRNHWTRDDNAEALVERRTPRTEAWIGSDLRIYYEKSRV